MPSSVIRSFHYAAPNRTLSITFTSGERYRYLGVPERLFEQMKMAASKGEFFNSQIRDRFRFVHDA